MPLSPTQVVQQQQAALAAKRAALQLEIDASSIVRLASQKAWQEAQVSQALGGKANGVDELGKSSQAAFKKLEALRAKLTPLDLAVEKLAGDMVAARKEEEAAELALSASNAERFNVLRDEAARAAARAVAVGELAFSGSRSLDRLEYGIQVVFGNTPARQLSILGFRDRFDQMLADARLEESKL